MSNKPERIYKFHVHFEPVFGPEKEVPDIRYICVDVYARSIEGAMATAWDAVTVNQTDFRIIGVTEVTPGGRFKPYNYGDE